MLFNDSETFYKYFIDDRNRNDIKILNPNMFKRRIQGLVSFYKMEQPSENILPEKNSEEIVNVEMSEYQYKLFDKAREIERRFERIGKKVFDKKNKGGKNFGNKRLDLLAGSTGQVSNTNPSLFRTYSRQLSNFAFPEEFCRPLPGRGCLDAVSNSSVFTDQRNKDPRTNIKNLVKNYEKSGTDEVEDDKTYKKDLEKTVELLQSKSDLYLTKDGLTVFSPKYLAILNNIQKSKGPIFLYSNFITAEGLGVFSLVLRQHGYINYGENPVENTIDSITGERYDTLTDREKKSFKPLTFVNWSRIASNKKRELLTTFNSDKNKHGEIIKAFLTTKSGTEGISLMNVRQVHIMEPYWNNILVDQAIARAIRRCSHITLPKEERKVDIFKYISTHDSFKSLDIDEFGNPVSTDQMISGIAKNKDKITDEILGLMQEAAIDCKLNKSYNLYNASEDDTYQCFNYNSRDMNKAFKTELKDEKEDKMYNVETERKSIKLRTITLSNGRQFRILESDFISGLYKEFFPPKREYPEKMNDCELFLYDLLNDIKIVRLVISNGKLLKYLI